MQERSRLPLFEELTRCRSWIEAALDEGGNTHGFFDIVYAVMQGKMQLWSGPEGCAVTEIVVYPKKKVLHVFLAGGSMQQIIDFQPDAERFAQIEGCEGMTIAGRIGWKRALKDHGWKEKLMTLERKL